MSNPTTLIPTILHTLQALTSAYTLTQEHKSITNILPYEPQTKKLAKLSNTADYHLWQTRKTLGFSTISTISSLIASSSLAFLAANNRNSERIPSNKTKLLVSWTLALVLMASHAHVSGYWAKSPKVPLSSMQGYNKSISSTNFANRFVRGLAFSWGVMGLVYWYLTFAA